MPGPPEAVPGRHSRAPARPTLLAGRSGHGDHPTPVLESDGTPGCDVFSSP